MYCENSYLSSLRSNLLHPALFVLFFLVPLPIISQEVITSFLLGVDAITGDDVINIAERAAGFSITGDTGTQSGASVSVTLGTQTPLTATSDSDGDWSVAVPANASYLTGTSVTVTVAASKTGFTSPSNVTRTLTVDLTGPTARSYTAPASLKVGTTIKAMIPSIVDPGNPLIGNDIDAIRPARGSDIDGYRAAGLPAGLEIDSSSGIISGTPTTADANSADATVTVSDTAGNTAETAITFPAVAKGDQTLTGFRYSATSVTFGRPAPTLTAPTGAVGTLSYSAAPATVCSVNAGTGALTLAGVGTCTVTATAAATTNYNEGQATFEVTVQDTLALNLDTIAGDDVVNIAERAAGFSITGDTGAESGASVSVTLGTQTPLTATSDSDGDWSVTVPANASYLTGTSVTVTVAASKTGFTSPSNVTRTLTVDLTAPTAPGYTVPSSLTVGTAISAISPAGGSGIDNYRATGLPPGLTIHATTGAISGTPTTADANRADATVTVSDNAGNTGTAALTFPAVAKGDQTLAGFKYSATSVTFGHAAPTLTAPSGAETTLSYATNDSAVCTVNSSSGALTLAGVGSCTVTATAAGTANWHQATATFTLTVASAGTLALNLDTIAGDDVVNIAERAAGFSITGDTGAESGASVSVTLGTQTPLTATSDSDGDWSVAVPANASYLTGTSVTVTVAASKTGFTSPSNVTRTLTVDLTAPTAPGYTVPSSLTVGTAISAISPAGGSGIDNYRATGLPPGLTIHATSGAISGTPTTADADRADATVTVSDNAGNTATAALTFPAVAKGDQTLAGFKYSATSVTFGRAAPTLTAPSGAETTLSYATNDSAVCTVNSSSGALTLAGVGSCTVTATAAGTANWHQATATFTLTVASAGTLALNLDTIAGDDVVNIAERAAGFSITGDTGAESGASVSVTLGTQTPLTATSDSDGDWSVAVPANASYLTGTSVTVTVAASKTGFTSPSNVTRSLTVDLTAPTAPGYTVPSSLTVGTAISAISPAGGSGIDNYRATGLPPGLTIHATSGAISGTPTTADADRADATVTVSDNAGNTATAALTFPAVAKGDQTLAGFKYSATSVTFGHAAPTLTAPSGAETTLSYATNDSAVCTVNSSSGALTLAGVGSCTVTATAAGTANWHQATATFTLTVAAALMAPVDALVSTVGQSANTEFGLSARNVAQGFITGSHVAGYRLTAVDIVMNEVPTGNQAIAVYAATASNTPEANVLYTLTAPATTVVGSNRHTAPAGAKLAAGTRYFVVIGANAGGKPAGTFSDSEDTVTATGWSIDNNSILGGASNSTVVRMAVIGDNNNAPMITTTSPITINENVTAVAMLAASDDDSDSITWSTDGGADAAKFNLTTAGVLTFVDAPDHEVPDDDDADNTYEVVVQASDGIATAKLTMNVQVDDVAETDATLSALSLSDTSNDNAVSLDQTFVSGTTMYTASVAHGVSQITVTAEASHTDAMVSFLDKSDAELADADTIAPGHQVDLAVGVNTIKVQVTAEDSTVTRTYVLTVTSAGTLALNLDTIAGDDVVNIAERAAGFSITGDTGAESGASVSVTLGTQTPLTATSDSDGDWSVAVPANASYLTGTSVTVTVAASKTGLTSPSNVTRSLTVDLTAPTAPGYTAPSSLTVGTAISAISPAGGSGIDNYRATGLPPGLTIHATTGAISGTPTTADADRADATVTVSDNAGNTATAALTFPAVAKGDQTLAGFKYSATSVTFGHAAPTLTAPSGAETTLSYATNDSAVCTVNSSSGALTLAGVGSCTVTATAAGTANWHQATATFTLTVASAGTLALNLDTIAGDDVVNIAERAAGFSITGDTGAESGASVSVTLGTQTPLTATSDSDGDWSVAVPANASYLTGTSVTVTVAASKTGLTSPSNVTRSLTVDLTAPTAPGYTAPSSLTVGTAISAISPAGGSGIDNYRATGLPPGLTIHATTGAISGTPTTADADRADATVTVSDNAGNTATAALTFPAVAKGDQTLAGFKYSATSVTFGHAAPTLTAPSGAETTLSYATNDSAVCTVNSSSGALTLAGVGSCTVTATAAGTANWHQATATFTLTVASAGTLALNLDTIAGDDVVNIAERAAGFSITGDTGAESGASVSVTLGTQTPLTATSDSDGDWSVAVPANASYLTGTSVTVTVAASKTGLTSPSNVTRSLTVDLTAPTAPGYTVPSSLTVGTAISAISPSGGSGIDNYRATGLPAGLTIHATSGAISGTPTTADANRADATVTVSDNAGNTATAALTFPAVAKGDQTLAGFKYSATSVTFGHAAPTLTAPSGAETTLSYATNDSAVCTVNSSSGALTLAGVGSCTVTATAAGTANWHQATATFTLTVASAGTLALNLDTIAGDDVVNIAERAAGFSITGDTGAESGASVSVTLGTQTPLTATSDSDGDWSVAVPANASYLTGTSVTVTVAASKTGFTSPSNVTRSLTVDLTAPTAPGYTVPSSLTVGTAISAISPSGGSGIDNYRATGLPPGLTIHATTGAISGTPTTADANRADATVTVSDNAGNTATAALTFPAVAKGDQTLAGFKYSATSVTFGHAAPTLTAPSGAETTLSYATNDSAVCTVNSSSGALTLAGVGSCTVTATAAGTANWHQATATFTLTVASAGTLALNLDTIAGDDVVNIAERAAGFSITGDTGAESGASVSVTLGTQTPLTATSDSDGDWSVAVPANASYLTGTSVTVTVAASKTGFTSPSNVTRTLTVDLTAPTAPGYTVPSSLTVGTAISAISPAGGSGIDNYRATGLPPGLTIHATSGAISGTPTTADADRADATVTVSDNAGNTATAALTFPAVAKGDQTLAGFKYSATSVTFGRAAPTLTAPSGAETTLSYATNDSAVCTVNSSSGALTLAGVGSCTVTATAAGTANWHQATATFTLTVASAGTLALNLDTIAGDDVVNIAERAAGFSITGDTGAESGASVSVTLGTQTPLTATSDSDGDWSVAVPANASYLTGTSVTVTVAASKTGFTSPSNVTRSLTVDLTAPTAPGYTVPSSLTVGTAISAISPAGGSGIDNYRATGLPPGLTIHATTGAISGTPTTADANSADATVTVSDNAGNTGTAALTFPAVAKGDQTLAGFKYSATSVTFGHAAPTLTAPSGAETTLSYATNDSAVCTVNSSSGALTLAGVGSCTVTATAAGTANWHQATATFTLTVASAGTPPVTPPEAPDDNTDVSVTTDDNTDESVTTDDNTDESVTTDDAPEGTENIDCPGEMSEITVAINNDENNTDSLSIDADPGVPQGIYFVIPPLCTNGIAHIDINIASIDTLPPLPDGYESAMEMALEISLFTDEGEKLTQIPEPLTGCVPTNIFLGDASVTNVEAYHLPTGEDQWMSLEIFHVPDYVCAKIDQFSHFGMFYRISEPASTVPGAPQQLAALGSNDKVVLRWVAPVETGSSALRGYTFYRGDGSACDNLSPLDLEVAAESSTAEDESVSPGVTYCYRLTASNDAGEGAWSDETVVKAVTVGAPRELTVTDSSPDSISLAWRAPATDDGGGPLDGYNVYRCAGEDCVPDENSWLAWVTDVTTYVDKGRGERPLEVDIAYRYAVAASRAGSVSALSNQILFTIVSPNNPPVANAGADQTVKAGSHVRLDGSGSEDPDNRPNPLAYAWKQVQGRLVILDNAASATPGFVAPSDLEQDEQLVFMLTVTDGILADDDSVVVTVAADRQDARKITLETGLAAFGRTVAAETVDIFGARYASLSSPGKDQVTIGGRKLDLDSTPSFSSAVKQAIEWLGLPAPIAVNDDTDLTGVAGDTGMTDPHFADRYFREASWQDQGGSRHADFPTRPFPHSSSLNVQTVSLWELLSRSEFQMALDERDDSGVSNWTLWGRGSYNWFKGSHVDVPVMEGDVFSGYLGLDFRWNRNTLLGIAVSHSRGETDYTDSANNTGGLETTLTSVYNHVRLSPRAGLNIWGTLGYGWGTVELTGKSIKSVKTNLTMWLTALGVRNELMTVGDIGVAVKADAFGTWLETGKKDGLLPKTHADSSRMRVVLEGSSNWNMTGGSRLMPSLELGVRWDEGDAETGLGVELGGGLSYSDTQRGLDVSARGRYLLAHEDSSYEEWGASLTARVGAGTHEEGLSLSVTPAWGQTASGVDRLWAGKTTNHPGSLGLDHPRQSSWLPHRMNLKLGYGMGTTLGVMAPFGELNMAEADLHSLRLGTRLATRSGWIWRLLGEHKSRQGDETDYLIGLFASYNFGSSGDRDYD